MNGPEKALNNNALTAMAQKAAPPVLNAIKKASARTGVDFAYLLEKAAAESSFNPAAKAKTSSATGLYQFIESTWLQMVRDHGAKCGMGDLAACIDDKGKVADPAVRAEILAQRKDPEKSAMLAAEYALDNQKYMERQLGEEIGSTELYFAHFMGAGGATAFMKALKENPVAAAADLFPKEARANRNVFYDRETGQPRTLAGVYDFFDRKFGGDGTAVENKQPAARHTPDRHIAGAQRYEDMIRSRTLEILADGNDITPFPLRKPGFATRSNETGPAALLSTPSLAMRPADIMMLAAQHYQTDEKNDEQNAVRAHRRQNRYNS